MLCVGAGNVWGQKYQPVTTSGAFTGGQILQSDGLVKITMASSDDTWSAANNNQKNYGITAGAAVLTDNIPTAGTFIKIEPLKDIYFVLQTWAYNNMNYYLIDSSNPTSKTQFRARYNDPRNIGRLTAGKTYYVYTDEASILNGIKGFVATSYENYTIHYVDGEATTIHSDVVHENLYGETVSATGSDLDPIIYGGNPYAYESGNTPIVLGTGTNEITLVYTPGVQYDYTINAVAGGSIIKKLATGSVASGVDYGTKLSKVIYAGGNHYVLTDANISNYYAEFTMGDADEVRDVEYTLDNSIVYYLEGSSLGGDNTSYSNGDLGQIASQNKRCRGESVGALSVGVYQMESFYTDRGSFGLALRDEYIAGGSVDANIVCHLTGSNNTTLTKTFLLENNLSTSCINSGDQGTDKTSLSAAFDYVIIRKLYDVVNPANVVGAVDMSSDYATSSDFTLKKGETKVFTFQNHGQDFGKNWRINVIEGETWRSVTRADSWDETAGAATKVAYQVSKDGGETKVNLDWSEYEADMADARVIATLAYGLNGTLEITTTSTGTANGYIYYVNQDVTGLSNDLNIQLATAYSWLEILSVESTAIGGTIPSSGYGSLASAHGLDFSSATVSEGELTAFVATSITKDAVTLTSIDELPANSGVILKGTAGATYSIPVKAAATFEGTNKLKAAVTATTIAANEAYILQGGQFHLVTAASTVPAGKAYLLKSDVPAEAKALRFDFDNATGIQAIEDGQCAMDDALIFNLAGQCMSKLQRGVNIVSGKKILVK